jgi:hypothetical protein
VVYPEQAQSVAAAITQMFVSNRLKKKYEDLKTRLFSFKKNYLSYKMRNELLGKIWTYLYYETDLNEESLKELCENIVEIMEKHNDSEKEKSRN